MALNDTDRAIGKVTKLLVKRLGSKTGLKVAEGRPEPPGNGGSDHQLNIFLYEVLFDPGLRNVCVFKGHPDPLWLVLKYLATAFDDTGNSDTIEAHEYLGIAIRALQELNPLPLTAPIDGDILKALGDNPEPLKISFDETPSDLLSKLMQGTDEKYRFSVGFQVRPVMIAAPEPPSFSLLVGVDYRKTPNEIIGEKGIQIPVLPSMGPRITELSDAAVEAGDSLTIHGNDLNLSGLSVQMGPVVLPLEEQHPNRIRCTVSDSALIAGTASAGSHPVTVVQSLPGNRERTSNILVVDLLPTLMSAEPDPGSFSTVSSPGSPVRIYGNIDLTGRLLASEKDDIFVGLYRNGKTVVVADEEFDFSVVQPSPPPTPPHSRIRLIMKEKDAIEPGMYRVILQVNGEQAKNSPKVDLSAP